MNPVKTVQNKLRNSENLLKLEIVTTQYKGNPKECFFALVSNKSCPYEQAIFLFRPRKIFSLSGGLELLIVLPLTKEIQIIQKSDGFLFRWLTYDTTLWNITTNNKKLINTLIKHIEEVSRYQREPFHALSNSHKWMWYYESAIPIQVRSIEYNTENNSTQKISNVLLPEHYGKDMMNAYIKDQLKIRETEYTEIRDIKMIIGTWNTAGKGPSEDLFLWFCCQNDVYLEPEQSPDMIVICLQEMCELSPKNIVGDDVRMRNWMSHICNQINDSFPGNQYTIVGDEHLMGLLTMIFVKFSMRDYINEIKTSCVKLGFKGYVGNKGAICMRFDLFESSVCIINCHLAAHKNQAKLRNEQIKTISKEGKFVLSSKEFRNVYEHDFIFWAGDLNYRLNNLSTDSIINKINAKHFSELLEYDQLNIEKRENDILAEFHEGKIDFMPSFKYRIGTTNQFNTSNKRDPAWCDRILWRGEAFLMRYGICNYIIQSDHKPVFSSFMVPAKHTDPLLFEQVKSEVYKTVDDMHHESMPKLKISENFVEITGVRYKTLLTKVLTLENVGANILKFEVKHNRDLGLHKSWLAVEPEEGTLISRQIKELKLNVYFGKNQARKLNKNPEYTNCIFVLGVKGGSDFFIEIQCKINGSCFGASIQNLIKIPQPIASLSEKLSTFADKSTAAMEIPKELARMVDFLKSKGYREKGIFQEAGDTEIKKDIRWALDTGDPFREDADIFSMSNILLEFLDCLEQPLLLPDLVSEACQIFQTNSFPAARNYLVNNLDQISMKNFLYIIDFLKNYIDNSLYNGLTAVFLAKLFTEPITHFMEMENAGEYNPSVKILPTQRNQLLSMFLYS
ncbi:OCRL_3 [Blepharisma stoltei]|uniref:Rho-GAP domain-containing protein n=1 Tax=Blepharisma stoltei TaxID=1481888 RepID=A0AAU9K9V2_9CILI|nr:unnamed protein product [Blepharisma stoltei]